MADLKTGGMGAVVGVAATALVMMFSEQEMDATKVQAALDTLVAQGKIAELPEVTDALAKSTDSIVPERQRVFMTVDTAGKRTYDTVKTEPKPVLGGFDENGTADYELAAIVKAGHNLRIDMIDNGVVVNSQMIEPKTTDWLISARPRASLHSGE